MERLEPILKQKFWILLGLGMILTITGWWMATGSLAATTKARTEKVDAAFKSIPSGEIPNRDWTAKLAAVNAEQDRSLKVTAAWLWEQQKSRMTWPETVAPVAWNGGYRGEIPLGGREIYRTAYGEDVRRVWEIVRPFKPLYGTGIVVFGQSEKVLPQRTWGAQAPSPAEMWDAQEDLWLIESLLRTILDINGGPEGSRGDAFVHAIENLKLFGGVPAAQRKPAAGPGGAGPGGPGGMPGGMPGGGAHGGGPQPPNSGSFGGTSEFGGGARAGGQGITTSEWDVKEDVGDDGSGKSGGGAPGGFGPGSGGMPTAGPTAGPSAAHGGGPGAGPGGAGAAAAGPRRYIEDDAALPFKTRGFYMTLVMDHRKIPGLIAELSANGKSPWPVEIIRVQMVRIHDNEIDTRGGVGGGGGFGPGPGSGGGGGSSGAINLQSLLTSTSSGGGGGGGIGLSAFGGTGPMGVPSSGPGPSSGTTGFDPNNPEGTNSATMNQAAAAIALLENALQEPFMARVSIAGIFTLYKEVKPEVAPAGGTPAPGQPAPAGGQPAAGQPAAGQPAQVPPAAGTPAGTDPANPAAPEGTPTTPADPATPAPGNGTPATPAPVDPNAPKPDPATPSVPKADAPKAADPKPAEPKPGTAN